MSTQNQLIEFDKLKTQITMFVAPTSDIVVTDAGTDIMAQGALKTLSDFEKQIEAVRVALKKPHLDATRKIDAYAGDISQPLEDAKKAIKLKREAFAKQEMARIAEEQRLRREEREKQERIALEARRKEEAEALAARAKAEAELKKKQEAEKKAFDAEQARKAEAMKVFGIDEVKAREEREAKHHAMIAKAAADKEALRVKAEEERIEAQVKFDRERAEQAEADRIRAREIEASKPKNVRMVPKYLIEDVTLLPREYWMINESKLGADVRAGGDKISIPGVKIWMEPAAVSR